MAEPPHTPEHDDPREDEYALDSSVVAQIQDAIDAEDRPALAGKEFRVAAAITPSMDRGYALNNQDPPAPDDPAEVTARGELLLRSAEAWHAAGNGKEARRALEALQKLNGAAEVKRRGREMEARWK